jgi:hypothetical protein
MAVVLLTGIPATGKSSYGRWLEANKGFIHLDLENAKPEHANLVGIWWGICKGTNSVEAMLQEAGRPVAVDWGFPPHLYPWVQAAKDAGVSVWWFDGDRAAARESFIQRDTVPVAALDVQMASIANYWPNIEPILGPSIIEAIKPDGSYEPLDAIFKQMFPERV